MNLLSRENINLLIIIFGVISVINIFLGVAIRKYNIAEIISGYDSEIDNPEMVCNLTGKNISLMGILGLLITIIYFFLENSISVFIYIAIYITILVALYINIHVRWKNYRMEKYKENTL